MKTIKELRIKCIKILNENNIEDSTSKVNLIFQRDLECNKQYLIVNDQKKVNEKDESIIKEHINMIIDGTPIEYITNHKEFMNYEFFVNESVLIPRADTEILVENLVDIIQKISEKKENLNILELCTGSGCITISTLNSLQETNYNIFTNCKFVSTDISDGALEIANINANRYNLTDKIKFIKSDLFENIKLQKFDIIVSNPPYIESENICKLNKDVKEEPYIALDGGNDGLDFYRKISKLSKKYLEENGYLIYEIGYNQAQEVSEILNINGYRNLEIIKDLGKNDRVIISRR